MEKLNSSKINISKIQSANNVHFIGIGGIGISAIARMMVFEGKKVSGQDMQDGEIVQELKKIGIEISIGQSFEKIPEETELIIYTVAIETYDKDLFDKLKSQSKFQICSYPEMLGVISSSKYTIAVCGTHGKTTTTGMIAKILKDGNYNPTVVVGSLLKNEDGSRTNFIGGQNKIINFKGEEHHGFFVVEACEYRRSFLNINPNILVITNIDEDHLDYYKDIEDIKSAFREMALKVPDNGYIVCDPNDKNLADVVSDLKAQVIDYRDFYDENLKLKIPGIHNKKNAAAAVAVANILDVSELDSKKYLSEFPGTWKRFEYRGKLLNGELIYDDYAHHPTEIIATLEGFRELYSKENGWNITVVFQPHLFSRTKLLLKDFAESFKQADCVLILPIYYAREVDDGTISSQILAEKINKTDEEKAQSFPDFESLEVFLNKQISKMKGNNIIITMGAGEAFKIGDFLLKSNKVL